MTRYLFVLSYSDPARFEMVQGRLAGKDDVEVVLDRRYRDRRRRDAPAATEQRRSDRRQHDIGTTLDHLGWALVRRR
ncbi:MAG: hypothetical protein ACREM3_20160 [Candidatus Rokuibacteriota bacterium]